MQLSCDPPIKVDGLLAPGDLSFVPAATVRLSQQFGGNSVLVAPFSENFRDLQDFVSQAESCYHYVVSGGVLVAAAPAGIGNFGSAHQESIAAAQPFDNFTCDVGPACLGATPFALTVAALGVDGNLFQLAGYRLGSASTWVAAPGEGLLTAAIDKHNDGTAVPTFALMSGTSAAVGVVGALARILQSLPFSLRGYQVLARIAATADLDEVDPKLVRYGSINIPRALTNASATDQLDTLWVDGLAEARRAVVHGQNPTFVQPDPLGYVSLFERGRKYYTAGKANSKPHYIEVRRILRVVRSKTPNLTGPPLFQVVYLASGYKGVLVPVIGRNMMFTTEENVADVCDVRGNGNNPCLVEKAAGDGATSGIDLTRTDVVMSPGKLYQ